VYDIYKVFLPTSRYEQAYTNFFSFIVGAYMNLEKSIRISHAFVFLMKLVTSIKYMTASRKLEHYKYILVQVKNNIILVSLE